MMTRNLQFLPVIPAEFKLTDWETCIVIPSETPWQTLSGVQRYRCGCGLEPAEGTRFTGRVSSDKQRKSLAVRQSSGGVGAGWVWRGRTMWWLPAEPAQQASREPTSSPASLLVGGIQPAQTRYLTLISTAQSKRAIHTQIPGYRWLPSLANQLAHVAGVS